MFAYWLQGGRVSVGFLGGAQIDRFGNLNSTVIGDYQHPSVSLPVAGGASEIASACGRIFVIMPQSPRSFVPAVDFCHLARARESNCVECQARRAGCHGVWCLNMALRMVSSLCMQATKATLGGLPCSRSRV